MIKEMLFGKSIYMDSDGKFNTIRRGLKWANLEVGETVRCQTLDTDDIPFYTKVCNVKLMLFADLIDEDLKNNYDMFEGREYHKLLKSMKEIYPGFDYREVIVFVELKHEPWNRND
jgi:hypothetical protein